MHIFHTCSSSDPDHQAAILIPSKPRSQNCTAVSLFTTHFPCKLVGNVTADIGIDLIPDDFTTLALFFGNTLYLFKGVGIVSARYTYMHASWWLLRYVQVLPLENKMKHPNHFKTILYVAMGSALFFYIFVGTMGYAVYGDLTRSSITLNLEESPERVGASM